MRGGGVAAEINVEMSAASANLSRHTRRMGSKTKLRVLFTEGGWDFGYDPVMEAEAVANERSPPFASPTPTQFRLTQVCIQNRLGHHPLEFGSIARHAP